MLIQFTIFGLKYITLILLSEFCNEKVLKRTKILELCLLDRINHGINNLFQLIFELIISILYKFTI